MILRRNTCLSRLNKAFCVKGSYMPHALLLVKWTICLLLLLPVFLLVSPRISCFSLSSYQTFFPRKFIQLTSVGLLPKVLATVDVLLKDFCTSVWNQRSVCVGSETLGGERLHSKELRSKVLASWPYCSPAEWPWGLINLFVFQIPH